MFSWSQVENSELKLILVLAWSSYSPPTPRMNSLPARWKKESRGWGGGIISDGQNHILFASCPSVLLLGSRVQTLQWRVPPVTRSCCGFRKHRTVSAPMGFVCLFSPPPLPSVLGREKKDDLTGDSKWWGWVSPGLTVTKKAMLANTCGLRGSPGLSGEFQYSLSYRVILNLGRWVDR